MSLDGSTSRRREVALFGGSLVCLVILASWWIAFMSRSVRLEYDHSISEIRQEAYRLSHVVEDPDFVHEELHIVAESEGSEVAVPLLNIPDSSLDIRPEKFRELESTLSRRQLMVLGEGGLLLGLLGVCILMLFRLVASRRAMQREVEIFVGQMTHEMKTPLAGLRALLETLQKGRLEGDSLRQALALGLRQVEREEHLVQTLLHAQRLRVMPRSLTADPVDLGVLVESFIENRGLTRPGTKERYPLTMGTRLTGLADRDAVWTILENLFDNSDKYGASRIEVDVASGGGRVRIRCTDDGQGFDNSAKQGLFQPFSGDRREGSEHKHGTGLGLYISRRLARGMGGELTGESPGIGGGASFLLELPQSPA